MGYPGQVIYNPDNKEKLVFLLTGKETLGEVLLFDAYFEAGGGVMMMHSHPNQDEKITVMRGKARFILPHKVVELGAGESMYISQGQPHHFVNAGDEELFVRAELRPALRTDELMVTAAKLTAEGKLNTKRPLSMMLQLSILFHHYPLDIGLPAPLPLLLKVLYPVAKLAGYKLNYETTLQPIQQTV